MKTRRLICSICQRTIEVESVTGWAGGHNAEPVNNGRCCATCNDIIVIPARLRQIYTQSGDKKYPHSGGKHPKV